MTLSLFQKITLGIAGMTALSVGGLILVVPHTFYASYGITLPPGPALLSELRAPGACLAVLGAVMLAGLARAAHVPAALTAGLTVYLAFPLGRVVGLALDGLPPDAILGALIVEVAIAGLLLLAFGRMKRRKAGS